MYDQFMMFTTWRDKIKPKLNKYYTSISDKLLRIKNLTEEVLKVDIKSLTEKLHASDKVKDKIMQKYTFLKDKKVPQLIDQILNLQKDNAYYMKKVRSTFYCSICDHSSHLWINIPKKEVFLSDGSCGEIARHTINYAYFMNNELAKLLMEFSKVLVNFSLSEAEKPVRIKGYNKIRKSVKKCVNVFKTGAPSFKPCRKFCEHYKFNANSPVLEGYQIVHRNYCSVCST